MRRQSPAVATVAVKSDMARAVGTLDELMRPSEWERLDDASRAQALAQFLKFDQRAERAAPLFRPAAPAAVQDWIAGVIGRSFQAYTVAAVRGWLATAPETAHLYVGGSMYLGTPSLVASVARQHVASWLQPSSYCYAPDPDALDQAPILLTLPLGSGDAFGQSLASALGAIGQGWGDAANRQQTIAAQFDALNGNAPPPGQAYLARLRATLLQLAANGSDYPWDDKNTPPVGSVTPEPDVTSGAPVVDATGPNADLRASLLRANGGVLIVTPNSVDVDKLLAALSTRSLNLQDGWPPLPLSARTILIGTNDAYNSLWSNSDVIDLLFRYEAWPQDECTWNRNAEATYAALATGIASYYSLPAPDSGAIGRFIQEGSRRADSINRNRLTMDLLWLHDLVVESCKLAAFQSARATTAQHVDAVLTQRVGLQRANIDMAQEAILSGENITPTVGAAIGQINGLGIIEVHPWEGTFAVPMRISATAAPGTGEQLLDVERESQQTDDSHIRGLLTMEGYFTSQYGQRVPLSLAARIRFEQEQGSTGGDSASAAELFALLSALSGLPIRRSLAVTGAVGQYGEIQPIGGVNFKITGFWDLCRVRRQLGEQVEGSYGVIIPAANARDLMLRPAVAQSIATEGWFHIWLASTIDEALPLLMGVAASTVHERVEQRLRAYAQLQMRRGGR